MSKINGTDHTSEGVTSTSPGREGFYTQVPGLLAYFEFCEYLSDDKVWKNRDSTGQPYLVYGDQWISYDDPDSIHSKVCIQRLSSAAFLI